MFVEVTGIEADLSDAPRAWRATDLTVYVTTSEASVYKTRNPEVAKFLRPTTERERGRTSCRFVLEATASELKNIGFGDVSEQIEGEAERQAAVLGRGRTA
jgi:hypothetical protein